MVIAVPGTVACGRDGDEEEVGTAAGVGNGEATDEAGSEATEPASSDDESETEATAVESDTAADGGEEDDDEARSNASVQEGPRESGVEDPTDGREPVDAGPCPVGWHSAEYYTEPECDAPTAQRVCAPDIWDAGCILICGCDGLQYCGVVWGSASNPRYGSHAPFSGHEFDPELGCGPGKTDASP